MMTARELHAYFSKSPKHEWSSEDYQTILRALALLAAVDESSADVDVSWLNILADEADADDSPGEARDFRSTAARIVALEQELTSVKRLYDCGIRAFKELDSLLAQVLAAQSELASVKAHAEAMAELLDLQLGTQAAGTWEWKRETAPILEAYRAAHPKDAP